MYIKQQKEKDNVSRREIFIRHTRYVLNSMNLSFEEEQSTTSDSYYFKVKLDNGMNPCIRISDHLQHNKSKDPFTLLYNTSKNANIRDIKRRIERSVKNIIDRSNRASMMIKLNNI